MPQDTVRTAGRLDAVERRLVVDSDVGEVGDVTTVQSLSVVLRAPAAEVWVACTTPDRLARWFGPVHGDLGLGNRYQVEGNAGGTVESCEPPEAFAVTWEFDGGVSRVAVALDVVDEGATRLTLVHAADVPRDFWDRFGPGATGVGWDLALLGLAHHLETGADEPAETSAWGTSDDARAFVAGSAERWGEAAVAAGVEPGGARAAAARTAEFYSAG
ncbi:SRPBCC domain-containing protein [Cellulomonas triticagri]|uniref:Polyketide cyclase n=1 Tax=Cellulomonas triticagri TaxID=2483352 RepID=A0A3M2J5S3_9CELL|nr:SRPBCC domain-containing protein [Cellulomonas triticagri]RMI09452.1 polyketide cyclase [Cellulomonas triticagri]